MGGIFFFQAEDGIRDIGVTGVQTCALPICRGRPGDRDHRPIASRGRAPEDAAMEAIRHELFAQIDVYAREPTLPTSPGWFGPNGPAVLDLLAEARAMTRLQIERVGSVGGSREL